VGGGEGQPENVSEALVALRSFSGCLIGLDIRQPESQSIRQKTVWHTPNGFLIFRLPIPPRVRG